MSKLCFPSSTHSKSTRKDPSTLPGNPMVGEYSKLVMKFICSFSGGVYIPTLTDALIKRLQKDGNTDINFAGIAIGNGELSEVLQVNSAINLLYFRGTYDYE